MSRPPSPCREPGRATSVAQDAAAAASSSRFSSLQRRPRKHCGFRSLGPGHLLSRSSHGLRRPSAVTVGWNCPGKGSVRVRSKPRMDQNSAKRFFVRSLPTKTPVGAPRHPLLPSPRYSPRQRTAFLSRAGRTSSTGRFASWSNSPSSSRFPSPPLLRYHPSVAPSQTAVCWALLKENAIRIAIGA